MSLCGGITWQNGMASMPGRDLTLTVLGIALILCLALNTPAACRDGGSANDPAITTTASHHSAATSAGIGLLLGKMQTTRVVVEALQSLQPGLFLSQGHLSQLLFQGPPTGFRAPARAPLYTFAVVHRGPIPAFRDRVPYVTAIVELEEGAKMPTNLVEVEPDPAVIKIGMAVEVVFDDLNDTISLPKFRPAT